MGQQEFIFKEQCNTLSNDEVAYRTKQYLTTGKIIDILLDIENGILTDIPRPELYMVDLYSMLADMYSSSPTEISLAIFKPEKKIYAVSSGVALTENYTILHKYNDFIMREFPVLNTSDDKTMRARSIREELTPLREKLDEVVTSYCSDIGNVKSLEIDGNIQDIQDIQTFNQPEQTLKKPLLPPIRTFQPPGQYDF